MRWVFGLILGFGLVTSASAEVPQQLHYNGYLTNAVGDPVECPDAIQCGDNYDLTFRLYDSEDSTVNIWEETHASISIYGGSFNALLGTVTPITPELLTGPVWLAVKVNNNAEMLPRQQVASAAYAIKAGTVDHAENAAQLGGLNPEDFASTESVTELQTIIAGTDDDTLAALGCAEGQVAKWDGSAWACADDIDTDTTIEDTNTQLTETEVDTMVANNGYAAQSELEAAQTALTELQTLVNNIDTSTGVDITGLQAQITALESAIATAQSSLATETTAREAADNAEATTRAAKDLELENALNADIAALSMLHDTAMALQTTIETLESSLEAEATLRAAKDLELDAEVHTHGIEITVLQNNLSTAQTVLSTAFEIINELKSDLSVAEGNRLTHPGALTAETTARTDGDLTLQGNINTVQGNIVALDASLHPIAKAGLPADLADGDDDSLGALSCTDGQVPIQNAGAWSCVDAPPGPPGAAGATGPPGAVSLVNSSPEPEGAKCENGGVKIDNGVDLNANSVLDTDEVQGTSYVCNGAGLGSSNSCWLEKLEHPSGNSFKTICQDGSSSFASARVHSIHVNKLTNCILRGDNTGGLVECWSGAIEAITAKPENVYVDYEGRLVAVLSDGSIFSSKGEYQWGAPPTGNDFIKLFGHTRSFCALRENGTAVCWQNHNPEETKVESPIGIAFSDVDTLDDITACGIKQSDGSIVCFGQTNYWGAHIPPAGSFVEIVGNDSSFCAIRNDSSVVCWGNSHANQTSPPSTGFTILASFTSQGSTYCGISIEGGAICWGQWPSEKTDKNYQKIVMGRYKNGFLWVDESFCAIADDRTVSCWSDESLPFAVPTGKFLDIDGGMYGFCGVLETGKVVCWGDTSNFSPDPPTQILW